MRLVCLAVGRARRSEEARLVARYADRARAQGRALGFRGLDLVELDESAARSPDLRKAAEAEAILAQVPDGAALVALDENGRALSSADFAARLARWRDEGRPACVLALGGPDGHGAALTARADLTLSLGAMTWPHLLARVLIMEQIYRATTILAGHPYHRA